MKKTEVWFGLNYSAWVPDRVIMPDSRYTYCAANGLGFLVVAFDGITPVGFVAIERLGYKNVKDWIKDNP